MAKTNFTYEQLLAEKARVEKRMQDLDAAIKQAKRVDAPFGINKAGEMGALKGEMQQCVKHVALLDADIAEKQRR